MGDGPDKAWSAPGWDAITRVFERIYPGQEPRRWEPAMASRVECGGDVPLEAVFCYLSEREGAPRHWHYVTYGLSELYTKMSDDPEVSGYGIELTIRIKCQGASTDAPLWPITLLVNMSKYVHGTGRVFGMGHYVPLHGPIEADRETDIQAVVFTLDPEAKTIQGPFGKLAFRQVLGITLDELAAIRKWDPAGLIGMLSNEDPMLVTDLERESILTDPDVRADFDRCAEREGASSSGALVSGLEVEHSKTFLGKRKLRLKVGALHVEEIVSLLTGRTPFGRPFYLRGDRALIQFSVGKKFEWVSEKNCPTEVWLTGEMAKALAGTIRPVRGEYKVESMPGFVVEVRLSEIKDSEGKRVIREVG